MNELEKHYEEGEKPNPKGFILKDSVGPTLRPGQHYSNRNQVQGCCAWTCEEGTF